MPAIETLNIVHGFRFNRILEILQIDFFTSLRPFYRLIFFHEIFIR